VARVTGPERRIWFFDKLICRCVGLQYPKGSLLKNKELVDMSAYFRHVDQPIQSRIDMVKLLRVYGGCLGVERRRRTWQAAISPGQEPSIR